MSIIGNPIIVGKKPEQTKTVSPTTSQQVVTPDSGKVLSSVTVNAAPLQSKTVTPNKAGFTVSPDSGKYGLSSVKVNGNSNLVAGNIKSGVTIFGVTGTYNPVTSAIIVSGLSSSDTITCSGGGKSYSATWDATAQHWEIVGLPLGTFTVTASNGTKTTTETVLIDIAGVYEIEMSYVRWLYKDGNEYTAVTGGWVDVGYNGYGSHSVTKNDTYIRLVHPENGMQEASTKNMINLSGFTKLCCETRVANESNAVTGIKITTTQGFYEGNDATGGSGDMAKSNSTRKTYTIDISAVNGNYYLKLFVYWGSYGDFFRIWLE